MQAAAPESKARVPSIDALRGLVMIVMALDHTRDFFHVTAQTFQPDDLGRLKQRRAEWWLGYR